ncbi:hypothetical protein EI94DRAFT_1798173 [Lactarius quietus]|nr:hypothetical protein EI94DRAFT_1798173 [Lactarius quietus]
MACSFIPPFLTMHFSVVSVLLLTLFAPSLGAAYAAPPNVRGYAPATSPIRPIIWFTERDVPTAVGFFAISPLPSPSSG